MKDYNHNGKIDSEDELLLQEMVKECQVLYMNKSQKWMELIKRFSNTGETGRCPDCGYEEKFEVIITDGGKVLLHFIVRDVINIHILMEEEFDFRT